MLVTGLEDLAGSSLAQTLQDDVGPQDQAAAAVLEELVDLIGRQPATLQELAGQGARLGEADLKLAGRLFELVPLQNRGLAEGVDQIDGSNDRPDKRRVPAFHRYTS